MSSKEKLAEIPPVSPEDERRIRENIPEWLSELKEYLPEAPNGVEVVISNRNIIPGLGVGGRALSKSSIEMSIDSSFPEKEEQLLSLKGSYFHEIFHVVQDFHFENLDRIPPVDNAIYEGAATRFEGEVVGSKTPFGEYSDIPDIEEWARELADITYEDFMDNWAEYKFYHPEKDRRWWFYRAGAYIVDKFREANPDVTWAELSIMDPKLIREAL